MNRTEAKTELERIVPTTETPALSTEDVDAILDSARIVDADGLAPVDDGYVETIDVNYAIAEAFDLKALRVLASPQIQEFTAEGARFKRAAPNFSALADHYRAKSTVGSSTSITVIELEPEIPDALQPRSTRVD